MNEAGLHADLLAAMRARDMQRVYVLRGLVTVIKNLKVEKQAVITLPKSVRLCCHKLIRISHNLKFNYSP